VRQSLLFFRSLSTMPSGMKGLTSFVSDIRNCASREAERKRVDKEMAKIRLKFANDQSLSGYDRKKYVWKLLYAYMLGYEVDFGHIQAINLCSSQWYSEKLAGYLACSLLLSDSPDALRLIVNVCKSDLQAQSEAVQALALHALANIGGPEFTENLFPDVARLFSDDKSSPYVRKKASLCLVRLHRKDPELMVASEWAPKIDHALESTPDLGFQTSTISLLIALLETSHPETVREWADCVRPVVLLLSKLVVGDCPGTYQYYTVSSPWLQVKLLRVLQFFPPESIDEGLRIRINDIVSRIVNAGAVSAGAVSGSAASSPPLSAGSSPRAATNISKRKNRGGDSERLNRTNAENAILFEAINVVIHLGPTVEREVRRSAANLLGSYISSPEANTRYLGLEAMSRLASNEIRDDVIVSASEHKLFDKFKTLIASQLHEGDVSIRRQALNLLYVICDKGNWQGIVDELLGVLSRRDPLIEEELVLKIAILAEANAPDPTWYLDVVLKMIEYAPDSVGEEVWYRAVQVIVNAENEMSQESSNKVGLYAAQKAYDSMGGQFNKTIYPHDNMLRLGTYLLGEFGYLMVREKRVTSLRLVELLGKHFTRMSWRCRGICLIALAKILNASPTNKALRDEVCMRIEALKDSSEPDLQQRSVELLFIINHANETLLEKVLAVIPPLSGGMTNNPLVARLKAQTKSRAASRNILEAVASGSSAQRSYASSVGPSMTTAPRVATVEESESSEGSDEDSD
jgi:AP-2 complex subunit alpha